MMALHQISNCFLYCRTLSRDMTSNLFISFNVKVFFFINLNESRFRLHWEKMLLNDKYALARSFIKQIRPIPFHIMQGVKVNWLLNIVFGNENKEIRVSLFIRKKCILGISSYRSYLPNVKICRKLTDIFLLLPYIWIYFSTDDGEILDLSNDPLKI